MEISPVRDNLDNIAPKNSPLTLQRVGSAVAGALLIASSIATTMFSQLRVLSVVLGGLGALAGGLALIPRPVHSPQKSAVPPAPAPEEPQADADSAPTVQTSALLEMVPPEVLNHHILPRASDSLEGYACLSQVCRTFGSANRTEMIKTLFQKPVATQYALEGLTNSDKALRVLKQPDDSRYQGDGLILDLQYSGAINHPEDLATVLQQYPKISKLRLGSDVKFTAQNLPEVLPSLVDLHLANGRLADLTAMLKKCPSLNTLTIAKLAFTEEELNTALTDGYPLTELTICECNDAPSLKKLVMSLPRLQTLNLQATNLRAEEVTEATQGHPTLKPVKLEIMPQLQPLVIE